VGSLRSIPQIVEKHGRDRRRLLDIIRDVHAGHGYLADEDVEAIAKILDIHKIEIHDMATFYHFFSRTPRGRTTVRLCKAVIEKLNGMEAVAEAFEKAAGCRFGETSADGAISLQYSSCIGMSDQPPSALINGSVFTHIKPADVAGIVASVRDGTAITGSRVETNLRCTGPVIFAPLERGHAVRSAVNRGPEEVIAEITRSKLRGRGGAGFPTGMKWDFCRKAAGDAHYVVCNADEGEPGTFKDRVIFSEVPDLVIEGMTVAGYAVGAREGVVYLRAEYEYLLPGLVAILDRRRRLGLLGRNICGKEGFDFDVRVQMGAGAYVCGEESSLLESTEGRRGAPRNRPPFPVTRGYRNQPTALNNAETLCSAARVLANGADWFAALGTRDSTGTKLLSVSGDCARPGTYEMEFGLSVNKLLELVGADNAAAVQVGGPSGACVAPKDFGRKICYEDLSTGGSVMVFGQGRDILEIVRDFTEFFTEESCGWCAPCRVGTTVLLRMLDEIRDGRGTQDHLYEMMQLGDTIKACSRCGLGQSAPNPFLTTLKNMRDIYTARLSAHEYVPRMDLRKAVAFSEGLTGRRSEVKEE
jgi:[NiFe] hydrogenase diaphorase moiety large subunit